MALFSLKNRTKYDIIKIVEHLKANPDLANVISDEPKKDFKILVLENLINLTTEESLKFRNCQMIVCKDKDGNLILGDRPFLFEVVDGFNFLTLSPYFLIAFRKCNEYPNYTYTDITKAKIITIHNEIVAANSKLGLFQIIKNSLINI